MGAWGVGPFANDGALDWLGHQIEDPIAEKIRETLKRFLSFKKKEQLVFMTDHHARVVIARRKKYIPSWSKTQPTRKVKMLGRVGGHDEAEAAAGLLNELTSYGKRWQVFNYVEWTKTLKKSKKRRKKGSRFYFTLSNPARKEKWKSGKPPDVLPENCRLIMERWGAKGRLNLNYKSEHTGLYSLAVRAVGEIMDDDAYLSSWRNGSEKRASLRVLLGSLKQKALTEVSDTERKLTSPLFPWRRIRRRKLKGKASKSKKSGRKPSRSA